MLSGRERKLAGVELNSPRAKYCRSGSGGREREYFPMAERAPCGQEKSENFGARKTNRIVPSQVGSC